MDIKDVEMEHGEKGGHDSVVDGQNSDVNLVETKVACGQEESPGSAVADDEDDPESRVEDQKPSENHSGDQDPIENGSENRGLTLRMPSNEAQQSDKDGLLEVPDELDHKTASDGDAGLSEGPENKGSDDTGIANQHEPATPGSLVKCSKLKVEYDSQKTSKKTAEDDETGTTEDQAAFMKELESFHRERALEFKPPRFYGQPLNCLKLWKAVTRLGGYDRVTGSKLWRQVGESFQPPKTCTTVSWTFRIFYEKSLLEYERHKSQNGELPLPVAPALPEPLSVENERTWEFHVRSFTGTLSSDSRKLWVNAGF